MWTSGRSAMRPYDARVGPLWLRILILVGIVGTLSACGDSGAPAGEPAAGEPMGEEPSASAAPAMEPSAAPATIAELFPPGEGREIVLSNCATCHAAACAAMGQRTAARWASLGDSHREHVPNLSEAELTTAFDYLTTNFSDAQPEPVIPPEFLAGGCTPF